MPMTMTIFQRWPLGAEGDACGLRSVFLSKLDLPSCAYFLFISFWQTFRIDWLAERLAVQVVDTWTYFASSVFFYSQYLNKAFNTFGVGMLNETLKDPYHLPHINQALDLLHVLKWVKLQTKSNKMCIAWHCIVGQKWMFATQHWLAWEVWK